MTKCNLSQADKISAMFQIRVFEHALEYGINLETVKRVQPTIQSNVYSAHYRLKESFDERFCDRCDRLVLISAKGIK